MLKAVCFLIGLILFAGGCASQKNVRYDDFDRAEIAEIRGNYVSGKFLGKTVLALNPRRETRVVGAITNTSVVFLTNFVPSAITNLIITAATNFVSGTSTNDNPPVPAAPAPPKEETASAEAAPAAAPTNAVVVVIPPPLTNETHTAGLNVSAVKGSSQASENSQSIRSTTRAVSTVTNNQTIVSQWNEVVTAETNRTVSFQTNQTITAVTNTAVVQTNLAVHDYYLCAELIAGPEFTIAPGENLTLLVDGERFAFSQTNSPAAVVGRKRFTTTLYRVPEELFAKIAQAKEVRVRVKGTNMVIERTLPKSARQNFREFLAVLDKKAEPDKTDKPEQHTRSGEAKAPKES